jgi:hypothetical protein
VFGHGQLARQAGVASLSHLDEDNRKTPAILNVRNLEITTLQANRIAVPICYKPTFASVAALNLQ